MKNIPLACLALLLTCGAAAQERRAYPLELRLDTGHDRLSRSLGDWNETAAQLSWRPTSRESLFGGYRQTERFAQRDHEVFAGAYMPIPGVGTVVHVEGGWSSTHQVLPRQVYLGEIVQPLPHGWVVSAGGKSWRYNTSDVRAAWVNIEKYTGNFRYAYQVQVSQPHGASWAPSHRLTGSWYRGDLTFLTLVGAKGREVENIFPLGLLQTDVRAVSFSSGLEIMPRWGLLFELDWTRQGDLYTRRSARLGTRFLF